MCRTILTLATACVSGACYSKNMKGSRWDWHKTMMATGFLVLIASAGMLQSYSVSGEFRTVLGVVAVLGTILLLVGMFLHSRQRAHQKEIEKMNHISADVERDPVMSEYNDRVGRNAGALIGWFFFSIITVFMFASEVDSSTYLVAVLIWMGIPVTLFFGLLARLNLYKNPDLALTLIKIPGYYAILVPVLIFLLATLGSFMYDAATF